MMKMGAIVDGALEGVLAAGLPTTSTTTAIIVTATILLSASNSSTPSTPPTAPKHFSGAGLM